MPNALSRKLNGYAALSEDELALLEGACAAARTVQPRYDLIREGDKPGPVFVVLDGCAPGSSAWAGATAWSGSPT